MTSTLLLTVPATRVLDDHAEYGVSCSYNSIQNNLVSTPTVVWRRYRDFEKLRQELHLLCSELLLPNLPSKHSWWTSRSAHVVNERQRQFEAFLREIEAVLDRPSREWNVFCQFVGVSPSAVTPIARRDSDDESVALREQVLRLQNQLLMLEEEEGRLKLELASKDTELAGLKGRKLDAKQMRAEMEKAEKEKNFLLVEVARLEALLNTATESQHELGTAREEATRVKTAISVVEGERDELKAQLARQEDLIESLRREITRLEEETSRMQKEIATLQRNLETNPESEVLHAEITRLKKEKGTLELDLARLEQAQQSAAAYGASVLAKLEKTERERAQMQAEYRATLEAESKVSEQLRSRVADLEAELKRAREMIAELNRDVERAIISTGEVMEANTLLKTSFEGEETELNTLRKQIGELQQQLASARGEYEVLKVKANAGEGEIALQLEKLHKQCSEYKSEAEKNIKIKMTLAARVETLAAENFHLREKNQILERRNRDLQGE